VEASRILPIEKGSDIVIEEEISKQMNAKPSFFASGRAMSKSLHTSLNPDFFPPLPSFASFARRFTCAACAALSESSNPWSLSSSSLSLFSAREFFVDC
jgi:hypothetical protein